MFSCPQCAQDTETLNEGYCEECRKERQISLDLHNARFDWWEGLSHREKGDIIRIACG